MTRSSGGLDPSAYYDELPAALWKPANLPQLPLDAPAELQKHIVDVYDPKKVYVLYRAQRRHGFQDLVQRFENQLVYGCQAAFCDTPTCFTCARRVAGKAPIRRFHDTSARTLACYLASQDNPERNLCRNPGASPVEKSAVFKRNSSQSTKYDGRNTVYTGPPIRKQSDETSLGREIKERNTPDNRPALSQHSGQDGGMSALLAERIERLREPEKKDSKSFIQNIYGTVSLKMLDWLSPQSLYALSSPENPQDGESSPDAVVESQSKATVIAPDTKMEKTASSMTARCHDAPAKSDLVTPTQEASGRNPGIQDASKSVNGSIKPDLNTPEIPPGSPISILPSKSRAIILPRQSVASDSHVESSDSDILSKIPPDRQSNPSLSRRRSVKKSHKLSASRPVPSIVDLNIIEAEAGEIDFAQNGDIQSSKPIHETSKPEPVNNEVASGTEHCEKRNEPSENPSFLPQTLSFMSPEIFEFLCNLMQDHGLCESHDLCPREIGVKLRRVRPGVLPLSLQPGTSSGGLQGSTSSIVSWKKFIEQSFFYVLSNPEELLSSFMTDRGGLMDSLSMWYIMVRLTRVSPTIVFDSLWSSSSRLFSPPKELQSLFGPDSKSKTNRDAEFGEPLESGKAAQLVLIYLHALVAAMPLKGENKLGAKASSWSRMYNGERRAVARELAPEVYRRRLRYYDAFTNQSALRLARRLFSGISSVLEFEFTRWKYTKESAFHSFFTDELVRFIEGSQISQDSADTLLDFSHERSDPELVTSSYHDLSKQMVEWARTVILNEWKGETEVPNGGVFSGALTFMAAMYHDKEKVGLNDSDFVIEHLAGRLSTTDVPVEWLLFTANRKTHHLLDYPYLFKASSLIDYFRSINLYRMRKAYQTAANYNSRVSAMAQPRLITDANHRQHLFDRLRTVLTRYLVVEIRRDRVLQDAFDQLWRREERELLRPFKVKIGEDQGEEGFDLGGVQQEFFRLAIAEALDPSHGTFSLDERTQMAWFVPGSLTPLWRFELIGLIVSLAVYNGLTLPVTFPRAMYRKLLGQNNTEIEHIKDGWPDLARNFTTLLEWDEEKDGSVDNVFMRTYEFDVESFGELISRDMSKVTDWPQFGMETSNPTNAPLVDGANRNAFVKDYIGWLTDVSIRPQFEAFKSGFLTCLDRRSLTLFEPQILQTVVEGVQEIDISELRRTTRYVGWTASHRTVRDFWSTVKRYDMEQKKKLLEFVTASDRVPVGGMQGLHFVLQKNGTGENGRLPTSYTCFATLLLPEYSSKEMLSEKLEVALNNAKGFGFA